MSQLDLILSNPPILNPLITKGWAVHEMENITGYINQIMLCVAEGFPEGLVYDGLEVCSPEETLREVTKARGRQNRRAYDIARNSVFMVKYKFSYKGESFGPLYNYLPYVNDGGLFYISGILYSLSPVLADRVFSVSESEIFVKLNRAKIKFLRTTHSFIQDGDRVSGYLAWSLLHNAAGRKAKASDSSTIRLGAVHTPLAVYLFARYGVYEVFETVGKCALKVFTEDNINYSEWPEEQYVICKPFANKPRYSRIRDYARRASRLVIVIERKDYTEMVSKLLLAFFYAVDYFPDVLTEESIVDKEQWQVILGYILFGDKRHRVNLLEDIQLHIESLDGYVDKVAIDSFLHAGIHVNNIYDVFVKMISAMDGMMAAVIGNQSSLYDKHLTVLPYITSAITTNMFTLLFKLKSNPTKELTKEGLDRLFKSYIKPLAFFHTHAAKHGELNSVSNPHDNMFFKITGRVVHQNDSTGGGSKEPNPNDPANHLHVSFAEVGGMTVLNKSDPLATAYINPCLKVDPGTGDIIRNPKFKDLLDKNQKEITRQR